MSSLCNEKLFGLYFHIIQIGWNYFYDTRSARDIGTMYPARNLLGLTNVTLDPFKNFHAATELVNRWTDSLIICAALTFFGMTTVNDEPSCHIYQITDDPYKYVRDVCGQILERYAMVCGPVPDNKALQCPFCAKTYQKIASMRKHVANKHAERSAKKVPTATTAATTAHTQITKSVCLHHTARR